MTHKTRPCRHVTDIIGLLGKTDNPQRPMYAQVALYQLPRNGLPFGGELHANGIDGVHLLVACIVLFTA